jgi:hypothetical protein
MERKIHLNRVLFAVMALVCMTAGIVSAATFVNQSITYQGKLTNASGSPLTGTFSVRFNIYNLSSGGTALSTDTHSVTATSGLFTTQIAVNQQYFDGNALWLGVKVGSDPEMTPRQEILPVPYALGMRPGAVIRGSIGNPTLTLQHSGGTMALLINTRGVYSDAVHITTSGDHSPGVDASTSGNYSDGVHVSTSGEGSEGIYASTSGYGSIGEIVSTSNNWADGMRVSTSGIESTGMSIVTKNFSSVGLRVTTNGTNSDAVIGGAKGPNSFGVWAESEESAAVYANTKRADKEYGVLTYDKMSAFGYDTNGGDIAEFIPVTDDVEPGTVLVIGTDGRLMPSATEYDTRVAGIVSTEPGVTLAKIEGGNPGEEIVAIAGRVPCKVDATKAPIHAGDLLTTSDTSGHAMKAEPTIINGRGFYPDGTILGKAMGSLENGTGTIEVLVTLQ